MVCVWGGGGGGHLGTESITVTLRTGYTCGCELRPELLGMMKMTVLSGGGGGGRTKLQALVYDILPSTSAVFSYAIGSRKLSANEQFFLGAQTVVSLLQTQIKQTCHL